jgi:hypothetical protein
MTLIALGFSILLGEGSLAWSYAAIGLPQFSRWILLFGAVWLIAVWRRWRWFASIGVVVNLLFSVLGLYLGFPSGWMFAGALGGLLAWDLTGFRFRLRFAATDEERRGFEGRHLIRVGFLTLLGLGLASLALSLQLRFSFEWVVLLALVAAFALSQLIIWLGKGN